MCSAPVILDTAIADGPTGVVRFRAAALYFSDAAFSVLLDDSVVELELVEFCRYSEIALSTSDEA